MITYRIDVADAHAHLFRVTLTRAAPRGRAAPEPAGVDSRQLPGARVRAPPVGPDGAPGRARAGAAAARQGELARALQRARRADAELPRLRLRRVGAHRLSRRQRAASSTAPACSCACTGARTRRTRSTIGALPRRLGGGDGDAGAAARRQRFVRAADYDELVDHPVELGRFWRGRFEARGVPHEFVVAGALPGFDGERLLADAKRICETADRVLARRRAAAAASCRSRATSSCSTPWKTATAGSSTAPARR